MKTTDTNTTTIPAFEMKPKDNGLAALIAAAKAMGMSDEEIAQELGTK